MAGASGEPGVILKLPELPHTFEMQLQWGKRGPWGTSYSHVLCKGRGTSATLFLSLLLSRYAVQYLQRLKQLVQGHRAVTDSPAGVHPFSCWGGAEERLHTQPLSRRPCVSVSSLAVLKMGIVSLPSSMAGCCWRASARTRRHTLVLHVSCLLAGDSAPVSFLGTLAADMWLVTYVFSRVLSDMATPNLQGVGGAVCLCQEAAGQADSVTAVVFLPALLGGGQDGVNCM